VRDQEAVERAVALLEDALAPFEPRPHWGKVFRSAPPYPRGTDFLALRDRYDPRGTFRNAWFSAATAPQRGR
jgi:xylitol oxidase